jgi:uncharacterized protein with NAD-binding domain and iron-sulfur cluster
MEAEMASLKAAEELTRHRLYAAEDYIGGMVVAKAKRLPGKKKEEDGDGDEEEEGKDKVGY